MQRNRKFMLMAAHMRKVVKRQTCDDDDCQIIFVDINNLPDEELSDMCVDDSEDEYQEDDMSNDGRESPSVSILQMMVRNKLFAQMSGKIRMVLRSSDCVTNENATTAFSGHRHSQSINLTIDAAPATEERPNISVAAAICGNTSSAHVVSHDSDIIAYEPIVAHFDAAPLAAIDPMMAADSPDRFAINYDSPSIAVQQTNANDINVANEHVIDDIPYIDPEMVANLLPHENLIFELYHASFNTLGADESVTVAAASTCAVPTTSTGCDLSQPFDLSVLDNDFIDFIDNNYDNLDYLDLYEPNQTVNSATTGDAIDGTISGRPAPEYATAPYIHNVVPTLDFGEAILPIGSVATAKAHAENAHPPTCRKQLKLLLPLNQLNDNVNSATNNFIDGTVDGQQTLETATTCTNAMPVPMPTLDSGEAIVSDTVTTNANPVQIPQQNGSHVLQLSQSQSDIRIVENHCDDIAMPPKITRPTSVEEKQAKQLNKMKKQLQTIRRMSVDACYKSFPVVRHHVFVRNLPTYRRRIYRREQVHCHFVFSTFYCQSHCIYVLDLFLFKSVKAKQLDEPVKVKSKCEHCENRVAEEALKKVRCVLYNCLASFSLLSLRTVSMESFEWCLM